MNKKEKKSPSKSAQKRKLITKDLKAKDAGSVKGGYGTGTNLKLNPTSIKLNPTEIKLNTPTNSGIG